MMKLLSIASDVTEILFCISVIAWILRGGTDEG